jgi:uncharacterized integral membrane protein (TIGR00698 family)
MLPTSLSAAGPTTTSDWRHAFNGVLFVALFSLGVSQIAVLPSVVQWGLSPLVIGILVGMLYGNTVSAPLSDGWEGGINFCARRLLRIAVALYGLNISLQQIASVGLAGLAMSAGVVVSTLMLGVWVGRRWFGLDRDTALLTAAGSAICGAAAVLAFESALRNAPHKSAVAVATVVLFGTFSLLLFPLAYHAGWLALDARSWGLLVGGTIHEVAQVVGAGSAMSPDIAEVATIVKMTRVALLVPVLLVLGMWLNRSAGRNSTGQSSGKVPIPWFAFGFLAFALINSMAVLPPHWASLLRQVDVFFLTMAMTALGMQTRLSQLREAGPRALGLAAVLFIWLLIAGYGIVVIVP